MSEPMDLDKLLADLELAVAHKEGNRRLFFEPYPKQREFMAMGAQKYERLLIAGNQVGKSDVGGYEMACHLTGLYPDWWTGFRFSHPVRMWIGGTSGVAIREGAQLKLLGDISVEGGLGTGFIPKDCIVGHPSSSRSATGAVDTVHVKHVSGGTSTATFKTYSQDRRDWQGPTLHGVWFDEEPPMEIYSEGQARLVAVSGISWMTFTPLMGPSEVVRRFLDEPDPRRAYIQMALTDAGHMTPERIATTLSVYPRHEWAARREGNPHLAGGMIFSSPVEQLSERPWALQLGQAGVLVPQEWPKIWGVDFGMNHPFAAVLMAWDRDLDTGHILHAIRMSGLPLEHADAMRRVAANVPVAWPHDGHQRESDGRELADVYRAHRLNMLATHATHVNGGYGTEAGIMSLDEAMRAGRFKVNELMTDWFQEYRVYHRDKNGQIVKLHDDLMSATRIAWMQRRDARAIPLGSRLVNPGDYARRLNTPEAIRARNDFDPFTGY